MTVLEGRCLCGRLRYDAGTPTLFFTDGRRVQGAVPLERIEAVFKEIAAK